VIAKADTMTAEEVAYFKKKIMSQIAAAKIRIYEFPEEAEDASNRRLKERVPFAVVGSNTVVEGPDGKKFRGRKYPWGTVNVSCSACHFCVEACISYTFYLLSLIATD
jgi:septin 7